MTNEESVNRAQRLAVLFVPRDKSFEFKFAVEAIAQELRLVAAESDWQRERLQKLTVENDDLKNQIVKLSTQST